MSQEGHLLILNPSLLNEVCKGWPTDESMPKPVGVRGVDAALELLERCTSLQSNDNAFVRAMGSGQRKGGLRGL